MSDDRDEKKPDGDEPEEKPTRLGKFIQKYSAFLGSFVIGAAGLIATSIWQYKQSEIARRTADSQQKIAETQADNQWRIERAKILAANLQVLASHGGGTADQRYGVLLSLTRGAILDPELAVSYALELGKDNPEYMKSVLASTSDKDYTQLAHAFTLDCEQRFGVTRDVDTCKNDRGNGDRSAAIARLIGDEAEDTTATHPGPLVLLRDERQVQLDPGRMAWLFAPHLTGLYQRRQWDELARFESFSTGAHLVAALWLASARTGELAGSGESERLDRFHADERKWLSDYLFTRACDGECKGRFLDFMLTTFLEAQGDYDEVLRRILLRPRGEVGPALGRLHARLLRCQVAADDLGPFRDRVLVPALAAALAQPKPDWPVVDDVLDVTALVPEPAAGAELAPWKAALGRLQKLSPERYQRGFVERRAGADRERRNPPPATRKLSFCNAAAPSDESPNSE
jgi:hypothetical protein